MRNQTVVRTAAVVAAWTLFGIVEGSQSFFVRAVGPDPIGFAYALKVSLPRWWLWAALTPVVVAFCRLVPLERGRLVRAVAAHVAFGTVLSGVALLMGGLVYQLAVYEGDRTLAQLLPAYFAAHSAMAIVAYVAVVGACHAWEYHLRLVRRDLEAARSEARASSLEASLSTARLEALRGQLQPHFLFNTLNTVSALALKGQRQQATRVLALLSDLLRASLDAAPDQLVPLESEVDFVERYLEIERARFGARIATEVRIDGDVRDVAVPSLLLQPLVENAIRHGIGPAAEGGTVLVRARRRGDRVVVDVEDSGSGFPDEISPGVGLGAARTRLDALYGGEAFLRTGQSALGGARVSLSLPIRRVPARGALQALG